MMRPEDEARVREILRAYYVRGLLGLPYDVTYDDETFLRTMHIHENAHYLEVCWEIDEEFRREQTR